jgi:hypothetical protein
MEARGTTNPLRRMTVRELQTLALVAEGALRRDRRASACELQDGGQQLHATQGQARRAHAARADAHRHPASPLGDGKGAARGVVLSGLCSIRRLARVLIRASTACLGRYSDAE